MDQGHQSIAGDCNYKLKSFNDNFGFNLETVVSKYNLKELADPETKKSLMASLERGNRQSVTLVDGDKETRIFIEAVPQYKTLNIYDNKMNKLQAQELNASTGAELKPETKKR